MLNDNCLEHHILFKTCQDLKSRLARGETVSYNFPLKHKYKLELAIKVSPMEKKKLKETLAKKRLSHKVKMSEQAFTLPDYESDESYSEDLDDLEEPTEVIEPEEIKTLKKISGNKRGRRPKSLKQSGDREEQQCCCVKVCTNTVTNRLRFSLRCKQPEDFKSDYLERGWDKVCHGCYFSDLYRFKKQNREMDINSESKKRKRVPSAPEKKRKVDWIVD